MKHDSFLSLGGTQTLRYLALCWLILGGWREVAASPLLAVVTVATCATDEPGSSLRINDPFGCTLGGGGALSSFASVTTGPFINLAVQAMAPGFPVNAIGAAATASVEYEFQVLGGNPGDIVPILISTSLNTTGTDGVHGYGFASLFIHSAFAGNSVVSACTAGSGCGSPSPSFQGTLATHVRSGSTGNTVDLGVQAFAGSSHISETASASADPFIFVDPSFPNANLYSVLVSTGVGNGLSTVPEPGGWAMASLGLLVCAGIRLKRLQ